MFTGRNGFLEFPLITKIKTPREKIGNIRTLNLLVSWQLFFQNIVLQTFAKKKNPSIYRYHTIHVYYLKMSDLIHEYLGTVTALMPVV